MIQHSETQKTIWTIGHSTRTGHTFLELLQSFGIKTLVDIRRYPGSRKYPHFNADNLEAFLTQNNIRYISIIELGGRRKANANSVNTGWRLDAFKGYADYMETDEFKAAAQKLQDIALCSRTAYMCSEAVWWSCHRALVSDYLKVLGWKVMHIMGSTEATEHPFTAPAKIVSGKLNYGK